MFATRIIPHEEQQATLHARTTARLRQFGLVAIRRAVIAFGGLTGRFDMPPSRSPRFTRLLDRLDDAHARYGIDHLGRKADDLETRAALHERRGLLLRQAVELLRREAA